ncbi:MAG: hypothetical protein MMC33_000338 [Icmadophila ericetorum]|nr:hypothetical protein [Icmadophila ericetorum]
MASIMFEADVLILGGGPAGLAAALTLSRLRHPAILFDSGIYRNAAAPHMHNVPTWDHRDPVEYRATARNELLTRYTTTRIVESTVQTLTAKEDKTFQATDDTGTKYTGKKVVLATGTKDIFPNIPGFHCLFCHGYEERDCQEAGVLAYEDLANVQHAVGVGCMALRLCSKVTIYTHGNEKLAAELATPAHSQGLAIDSRRIARFRKMPPNEDAAVEVQFEDGSKNVLGFLAHKPRSELNGPWADQLGLELTPQKDLKTTPPFYETTVHGAFAAGDCGNLLKIVSGALSSGMLAANGAAIQVQQGV